MLLGEHRFYDYEPFIEDALFKNDALAIKIIGKYEFDDEFEKPVMSNEENRQRAVYSWKDVTGNNTYNTRQIYGRFGLDDTSEEDV